RWRRLPVQRRQPRGAADRDLGGAELHRHHGRRRHRLRPDDGLTAMTLTVASRTAVLDVVVPVYNEERDLEPCVRRLHAYLRASVPFSFRITIADNASTDSTPEIA